MDFIDTHAHFDTFAAEGSVAEQVAACEKAGVSRVVAIGGSPDANELAVALSREYPEKLYATVGMDRDYAEKAWDAEVLGDLAAVDTVVAIGETGLDYHYEKENKAAQLELFEAMLDLALQVKKPVVVHSREADEDTVASLRKYVERCDAAVPGVLHCFTGSQAFADSLIDLGLYISFSGILTFKNAASLREVAKSIPLDRIVIETDAPYLAPVPYRGKRNEPAWVVEVAKCLAEIRDEPLSLIAEQTNENAQRLFPSLS